ncbi:MAG: exonuclease SbcCD subunit D [bacterium]|nr:exonuclease SbcCD subunit D [bacterium]
MKILHTADLHLGKMLNGYSLLEDQEYIIKKIEDIILANNVDVVVIAGDIFDRAIASKEALDLFGDFLNFLNKNKKYLISILGNHDGDRVAYLNHILKYNNIHIIDEPQKVKIDNCIFSCIPYRNIHQFKDYYNEDFKTLEEAYKYVLDDFGYDSSCFNMLVAHDYFTYNMEKLIESESEINYNVGGLDYLDVLMFKDYDYVALGHMHTSQKVGLDNFRYSGSILKYSFSEVNSNKSVVIVDSETKEFNLVPLTPKRDLVDIKGTVEELTNEVFYKNYNYKTDFFRAILPTNEVNAYFSLKAIYPYLMEIKIEEAKETKRVLEKKIAQEKDYLELFSMFYNEMENKEISLEEKEIVKKYLIGGGEE